MPLHAKIRHALDGSGYRTTTQRVYSRWIQRFIHCVGRCNLQGLGISELDSAIKRMGPGPGTSAYRQARNAVLFFYAKVLGKPLTPAKKPAKRRTAGRSSAFFSRHEVACLLSAIPDSTWRLMAQLIYGCGLKLHELLRCRIRDVDLARMTISVHGRGSARTRTMSLPRRLSPVLHEHLQKLHRVWLLDQADGLGGVPVPHTATPATGLSLPWQWLFPARHPTVDPDTGLGYRSHTSSSCFHRIFRAAAHKALGTTTASPSQLRRSFAVHVMESGMDWDGLASILGHTHAKATKAYIGPLAKPRRDIPSPLDTLHG